MRTVDVIVEVITGTVLIFFKCLALAVATVMLAYGCLRVFPITYNIDIKGPIQMANINQHFYASVILNFADSNDTVVIHIDSPGGRVDFMMKLINNIINSDAHTIAINEGIAASAAGNISMAADEQRANYVSVFLFHKPYFRVFGAKIHPKKGSVVDVLVTRYMEQNVFPYLTLLEIEEYKAGKNINIYGTDFIERINTYKQCGKIVYRDKPC